MDLLDTGTMEREDFWCRSFEEPELQTVTVGRRSQSVGGRNIEVPNSRSAGGREALRSAEVVGNFERLGCAPLQELRRTEPW